MRTNLVPVCLEFELFFGFMFFYNNEMIPYSTKATFKFICGLDEQPRETRIYLPYTPQMGDHAMYEIDNSEIISKRFGCKYLEFLSYMIKTSISGATVDKTKAGYTISTTALRKYDKNGVKMTPIGISDVRIERLRPSTNTMDPVDHGSELVEMDVIVRENAEQLSLF